MTYVMSDLHGCYDKYIKMLKKIRFSEADTLYILGDVIDRGPDGIRILLDMMERPNVVPMMGNHEHMFLEILWLLGKPLDEEDRADLADRVLNWTGINGGDVTLEAYCRLPEAQRQAVLEYLEEFLVWEELELNGNRFLLAHAGVGAYEPEKDPGSCSLHDFLWGETDYGREYYPDRYLVTGHTPTALLDPDGSNTIYTKNRHIAIDCGAVFSGILGCVCLDTLEEFYCV